MASRTMVNGKPVDTGASALPLAVIVSMTSEPESDEVMKNTSTST